MRLPRLPKVNAPKALTLLPKAPARGAPGSPAAVIALPSRVALRQGPVSRTIPLRGAVRLSSAMPGASRVGPLPRGGLEVVGAAMGRAIRSRNHPLSSVARAAVRGVWGPVPAARGAPRPGLDGIGRPSLSEGARARAPLPAESGRPGSRARGTGSLGIVPMAPRSTPPVPAPAPVVPLARKALGAPIATARPAGRATEGEAGPPPRGRAPREGSLLRAGPVLRELVQSIRELTRE